MQRKLDGQIEDNIVPQCDRFRYPELIVVHNGRLQLDIANRISVGWAKMRQADEVQCDHDS